MRRLVLGVLSVGLFFLASCSKEDCLRKHGYSSCEDLKSAFNLQDNDETVHYHAIASKCGCLEEKK